MAEKERSERYTWQNQFPSNIIRIFWQDIEKVVVIDMHSYMKWGVHGNKLVLPMLTQTHFYFILFDHCPAAMCKKRERVFFL